MLLSSVRVDAAYAVCHCAGLRLSRSTGALASLQLRTARSTASSALHCTAMGRKKIKIERIAASKNRQVTFNKRKVGLMKKAMELSILCDCVIGVIIMCDGKLYTYSSSHMDEVMAHYQRYDGPYEGLNNHDVSQPQPHSPTQRQHARSSHTVDAVLCVSVCPSTTADSAGLTLSPLSLIRPVGRPSSRQGELFPCWYTQAQAEWGAERRGGR